jgi:hypothetical protein
MKFYSWFSRLAILIMLFMPNALTHAITFPIDIHELVDKSDIVFIGRGTGSQCVINNIDTQDLSEPILGGLHIIRIDKVLYGTEEIKQELFSESHIGNINVTLKRNRKRKPIKLFSFQRGFASSIDRAAYYENESQLFFLSVSKFRETLPDTVVILDENWSPHGSQSQELTKSDLTEKFYFEACIKTNQATWVLSRKKQKKKVPTVEAFCEVMSIPNLVEREQSLRGLLNHDDVLLAGNAAATLRKIEQARKAKQKRAVRGQKE